MRCWLLVLAAAGCGRIAFDPLGSGDALDGGSDGDVGMLCTGPLGAPRLLAEVSSASEEEGAYLTDDGLELYFGSDRPGGSGSFDLYVAVRTDRAAPFGTPMRLAQLSTSSYDNDPFVTADGLTLYFTSMDDIYVATRPDRSAPWGAPQQVPELASTSYEGAPSLTSDGLTIYFSSNRPGGLGQQDLYRASRSATSASFGAVVHLATASSTGFECCTTVDAGDQNVLFTISGSGDDDIAVTEISPSGDLGVPAVYTAVSTADNEWDVFVTRDDRYIGYTSDRAGGLGGGDIYLLERACD